MTFLASRPDTILDRLCTHAQTQPDRVASPAVKCALVEESTAPRSGCAGGAHRRVFQLDSLGLDGSCGSKWAFRG
jgi:hypothetical protein